MIAIRCDQTGETWTTITEAAIANGYSVTGFKKLVDEGRYTPDGLSFTKTSWHKPKPPKPPTIREMKAGALYETIHDRQVMEGLNRFAVKLKKEGRI